MEFFAAPLPRAESDALIDRIQAHMAQHGFTFFAAELRASGEFIGMVGPRARPVRSAFHAPCRNRLASCAGALERGTGDGRRA